MWQQEKYEFVNQLLYLLGEEVANKVIFPSFDMLPEENFVNHTHLNPHEW